MRKVKKDLYNSSLDEELDHFSLKKSLIVVIEIIFLF